MISEQSPYSTPSEIELTELLNHIHSSLPVRGQKRQLQTCKLLLKIWIKSTERNYLSNQTLRLFDLTLKFLDGSRY